jgi:hypothetical protein
MFLFAWLCTAMYCAEKSTGAHPLLACPCLPAVPKHGNLEKWAHQGVLLLNAGEAAGQLAGRRGRRAGGHIRPWELMPMHINYVHHSMSCSLLPLVDWQALLSISPPANLLWRPPLSLPSAPCSADCARALRGLSCQEGVGEVHG